MWIFVIKTHFKEKINMKKLNISPRDKAILKELVKNPRESDNSIAKNTGIAVKTVNRRRRFLEKEGIVGYNAFINNYDTGTGRFNAMCIYMIHFEYGITTEKLKNMIHSDSYNKNPVVIKHVALDFIGEKDGRATYSTIIVSRAHEDLVEILNAEIIPMLNGNLGKGSIFKIEENAIRDLNKVGHNYRMDNMFDSQNRINDSEIYIWD